MALQSTAEAGLPPDEKAYPMSQDTENKEPNSITVYPVHIPTAADTINLVSLWSIFWNLRKPFFLSLLVFLLVSLSATLMIPKKYSLSTTLEIGSYFNDGDIVFIDNSDSLRARIVDSYLPRHYRKVSEEFSWDRKPNIHVKQNKSKNIIVISSILLKSDTEQYKKIHKLIVDEVIDEHRKLSLKLEEIMEKERDALVEILSSGNGASRANALPSTMKTRYIIDQTRLLDSPTLSIYPVSMSRTFMLALFGMLSIGLSFMLIMLLEIRNRAAAA